MERFLQSAKQAIPKTTIYLGVYSAIITIIGIVGYNSIIPNYAVRVICALGILLFAYFAAFISGFLRNSVTIQLGNNRILSIERGALFSCKGVIVVPFNRYFDTLVDDKEVISKSSVAGEFVTRLFPGNLPELDRIIESTINSRRILSENKIPKPGKEDAYPIGTVITIQKGDNDYYCVAQTDVEKRGELFKSFCTEDMLHKAILELLRYIDENANGRDVYMPLLGGGFSRINKDKQVILEYLVSVLKMSDTPFQSKLHIVLRDKDLKFINLSKSF